MGFAFVSFRLSDYSVLAGVLKAWWVSFLVLIMGIIELIKFGKLMFLFSVLLLSTHPLGDYCFFYQPGERGGMMPTIWFVSFSLFVDQDVGSFFLSDSVLLVVCTNQ